MKDLKQKTSDHISYEDVYELCRIEFDREYYAFKTFIAELKPLCVGNCADPIRQIKNREINPAYEKLKAYAEKYHTTPFDFLTLMTRYHFSSCTIKTDNYAESIKFLIAEAYPNKDISGIRRSHPELYEQLRQLQHYYPTPISMKTLVESLGFNWPKASSLLPSKPNEQEVLDNLKVLFPKKIVSSTLRTENYNLYSKVVRLARSDRKSISEWLTIKVFSYPSSINAPLLSQININPESRIILLKRLKQKEIENMHLTTSNEIELFHASLKATQNVIHKINSTQTVEILKLSSSLSKNEQEKESAVLQLERNV